VAGDAALVGQVVAGRQVFGRSGPDAVGQGSILRNLISAEKFSDKLLFKTPDLRSNVELQVVECQNVGDLPKSLAFLNLSRQLPAGVRCPQLVLGDSQVSSVMLGLGK
jgi:hypothetical protein